MNEHEPFKTTEHGEHVRVRWVIDPDYVPTCYTDEPSAEELEQMRKERAEIEAGTVIALGAIVEHRCDLRRDWFSVDSLWGIIVEPEEDLAQVAGDVGLDLSQPTRPRRLLQLSLDLLEQYREHAERLAQGQGIEVKVEARAGIKVDHLVPLLCKALAVPEEKRSRRTSGGYARADGVGSRAEIYDGGKQ